MSEALALDQLETSERRLPIGFGVYRAVERIAEGGMGVVYRAEDERGGPPVAIKTVLTAREADAAAIRREIVTLSQMSHPGIVRLRGYGVQRSGPWVALELLDGRTLADQMSWYWSETTSRHGERRARSDERPTAPVRARRGGPGPVASLFPLASRGHLVEAFAIVRQLCSALDHLHARGIVHRDVKPSNVFLGNDGRTTLIDFGLACPASTTGGPDADICVGTMEYAAPEQICGGRVDHRADIYSLGCLLYELVTGRLPFQGDSSDEIAERQIRRDAIAPSQVIADVPSHLDDLILSMLAKAPAHRPDSAAEIARQLERIERRQADAGSIERRVREAWFGWAG